MVLFPHCMWGYIVVVGIWLGRNWVPSLYVRVYRLLKTCYNWWRSSLTVCEGVSWLEAEFIWEAEFPHCMWECIARARALSVRACGSVPSLYVRVHHKPKNMIRKKSCSLIICEGVSITTLLFRHMQWFPHYMWGCIGPVTPKPGHLSIPSLYVRGCIV